jgi:hypothetical protein
MLKTLRITSFIAAILALCGTAAIIFMGLKENPKVKTFLEGPGIVERFKDKFKDQGKKNDKISPLVVQAKEFALRIDPPPPPKPPAPAVKPQPPVEVARVEPPKPVIPTPKVAVSVKSDLLATVLCVSVPEKSLALLKTSGDKQEWFRQGEKVGHLEIKEIRDGSVVFTQDGKNPQEKFVPEKTEVKSLLKSEQAVSTAPKTDSGNVAIPRPALRDSGGTLADIQQPDGTSPADSDSGSAARPIRRVAGRPRADVSTRIQRSRSIPPPTPIQPPTLEEQKESLEQAMSGLKEMMRNEDAALSEEDRKNSEEIFSSLMSQLKEEAAKLEGAAKEDAEKTPEDKVEPAPSDPNESK